ncbi:MAG: hypothetical protein FD145_1442 [Candidatus Saganbacteria bacterium]|uniref:Uncharacterized protein n=1 Tax=Candidatus Saganbacteria bacterium TaxID=2575572 RepID=A0A833KZW6_UNCSA|nr:MAG: hypothetical protein FD145_1442 [Candidatus Saganbacteria bacterium]
MSIDGISKIGPNLRNKTYVPIPGGITERIQTSGNINFDVEDYFTHAETKCPLAQVEKSYEEYFLGKIEA